MFLEAKYHVHDKSIFYVLKYVVVIFYNGWLVVNLFLWPVWKVFSLNSVGTPSYFLKIIILNMNLKMKKIFVWWTPVLCYNKNLYFRNLRRQGEFTPKKNNQYEWIEKIKLRIRPGGFILVRINQFINQFTCFSSNLHQCHSWYKE